MAHWTENLWYRRAMLVSGVAIWLINVRQLVLGLGQMDFIQAVSAGMIVLILPALLWRDWNARKGTQ